MNESIIEIYLNNIITEWNVRDDWNEILNRIEDE